MATPAGTGPLVLGLLREGPQTAQQVAARLGLDVSSVRRHLDAFQQRGWVASDDRIDGPGRPKRHYRLTDLGWESFPRDYAFLLGALLDKVQARVGRDALLDAFAGLAVDLAAGVRPDQPVAARMEALRRLYLELGFEPEVEDRQGTPCLVQRNCPFLATARNDPEALCACLDEGIIRAAFPEAQVELTSCMATGDGLCRHRILTRDA